jgi:F-type H+-transporting ATPase subunit delta
MAELATLARPYARAAFEFAREAGALDAWNAALEVLAAVARQPAVAALLTTPEKTAAERVAVLSEVCGGDLEQPVLNFLSVMAENDRVVLLPEVCAQFSDLKDSLEGAVMVEVTSAFDVSEAELSRLSAAMTAKLSRTVSISSTTDASLMGGAIIRAGDLVIDGSVRGRLNKLAGALTP